MSKIEELISKHCPNGVEYKCLGDVCDILDNQRKPISKANRESGEFPYYGANGIQDWVSGYLFDGTFLLVGEDGSVINADKSPVLNWATGKIWVNNHAHVLAENADVALLRYVYFALSCVDVSDIVRGVPPKLNQQNLRGIKIPIPPLSVQQEIVRILDGFSELEKELEKELVARRKQYEYYRNQLVPFGEGGNHACDVTKMRIGDIGPVCMCKRIMKNQTNSVSGVPFYKIGTFGKIADAYIAQDLYKEYKCKYSFPNVGEILLSASGTIGKTVVYDGQDAYFQDSNIVWLKNDETKVINKYLFYLYQIIEWPVEGGTIKRLYNDNFKKIQIVVPSIAEQKRIVAILDKFDALVNDISVGLPAELKARRKQYEYWRNKLLDFKEAV